MKIPSQELKNPGEGIASECHKNETRFIKEGRKEEEEGRKSRISNSKNHTTLLENF